MAGIRAESRKLTQLDFALAGGGSGFITRMLTQPLDVLKIRFQLQVEPISKKSVAKYQSIFQAVNIIVKEEGVKSLWKGHVPAQFLSVSYGVAQFWAFEKLAQQSAALKWPSGLTPILNFSCGAVAGCAAVVASFPFDVLRTRLIAQNERCKIYLGVCHACKTIIRDEGFITLYRGMLPTFIQIAPHGGVQFMTYTMFDKFYKYLTNTKHSTLVSSLVSGSFAGLCAKTAVYPLDLAKKRLQIQGFEHGRTLFGEFFKCQGLGDCMVKIYQIEGFNGLYKGLSPSLLKAVCTTALHFSGYEMICNLLRKTKS